MKPSPQNVSGELLMLRLAGPRWSSSLERQLQTLAPGGILIVGPLPDSPDAVRDLLNRIAASLPVAPFLAIDLEGGCANPLSALLPLLPSPREIGAKGQRAARQAGELIGEALKLLGFNSILAPGLDVSSDLTEDSPGTRTFSEDPRQVAQCGGSFVEGLERHKILACAKHFPGLASVPPCHEELPVSGRSMAGLWAHDLVPYRELLERLPLIMMSTAAYKAYDFDYPLSATLSKQVVEGLLRTKLGYRGVVIAPQLESPTVRGVLDLGRAAAQAVSAGCDVLLVEKEESWQEMERGIEDGLESGRLPRERWEQALAGIRAVKMGLRPARGQFSKTEWQRLVRRFEEFSSSERSADLRR